MVLRMPDVALHLGSDLDAAVPAVFSHIDEPALLELSSGIEPAVCTDCGADDWADLGQQMHYIFHLFRACHEKPAVFEHPFTRERTAILHAGRIPASRL